MLAYDKPLVREIISQYITLIKQLTGQDMNKDSSDKIVDLAINNMEAVVALMDNRAEISSKLRTEFIFKPLNEFAVKMGMEFKSIKEGNEGPALKFRTEEIRIGRTSISVFHKVHCRGPRIYQYSNYHVFQNVAIHTGLMDGNGFHTPIGTPPVATYQYVQGRFQIGLSPKSKRS